MTTAAPALPASLEVTGVSKSFNGITVLDSIALRIEPGEVVGLIGQNGSGKSTFIKVLSGFHSPDEGARVLVGGREITDSLQEKASKTGLSFIHQDLALVESMTVLENLRIGNFQVGPGRRIRWKDEAAEVRRILELVGLDDVDPYLPITDLSVTEKALVVIARGLAELESGAELSARTLVLDEPTAYLPASGVERLFGVIRRVAAEGVGILFVSHRLDEVLHNCRRAIVFRGGRLVADVDVAGRTERDLIELMLGEPPEDLYPDYVAPRDDVRLVVERLCGDDVDDVSFTARSGEIIGFVGLPGSGYDRVPYLLAGASRATDGTVTVDGVRTEIRALSPLQALRRRIVLLPADRKGKSGVAGLKVGENLTIPTLRNLVRGGVIRHRHERRTVAEQLSRFAVQPADGDAVMATLSGGNQQKVLIAKWAIADPTALLLHEPTQGVDVGAKHDVFAHLAQLAQAGTTILVASVEYEDLAALCTRVHVLRGGRIVRTVDRAELTPHELAAAVYDK
ncbi:sugar ABC transporter ATP-binding protein [Microbacterium sp.]|uniref:sugar ABC transporter ATP-binding protein n=1 Tax=Microbacterium sp. TaxID=51671 RepID=UPI003A8E00A7